MSLLYEYAQSSSQNMDYVFLRDNLAMLKIGMLFNEATFKKNLLKAKHRNLSDIFPSTMLCEVLDVVFESCLLESDVSVNMCEEFEIEDDLFYLITSNDYAKSKLQKKIEQNFDYFSDLIYSDLYLNDISECDEDEDDYEEEGANQVRAMFNENMMVFKLYYTEQIPDVAETLIELKSYLIEVKKELEEELNESFERVAA